jgi:hypothetical protein
MDKVILIPVIATLVDRRQRRLLEASVWPREDPTTTQPTAQKTGVPALASPDAAQPTPSMPAPTARLSVADKPTEQAKPKKRQIKPV